jgi:hypothetical protein
MTAATPPAKSKPNFFIFVSLLSFLVFILPFFQYS